MTAVTDTPDLIPDADGWVHLDHPATNGHTKVRDRDNVIASHLGKGWVVATPPGYVAPVDPADAIDTTDMTVPEVLAAVDGDPARARAALASERPGRNRASLIRPLTAIAEGTADDAQEA